MKIREVVTCVRFRDFSIFLNDVVVFVLLSSIASSIAILANIGGERIIFFILCLVCVCETHTVSGLVRCSAISRLPNSFGGYITRVPQFLRFES